VEEIWATKAPRTMARQLTTKASRQPVDFETLKRIVFWVWVVMALSGSALGFESLSYEWRQGRERCDSPMESVGMTGAWRVPRRPLRNRLRGVGYSPGEEVHVCIAVDLARRFPVVDVAEDTAVVDRGRTAATARHHVIDLGARLGAADSTRIELPLALAGIAPAHLPLHAGWNTGPPLLLLGEEQVQRRLEHLLVGCARLDVGLARPRLLQLPDERPRDGEVDAAQRGGERFDDGPCRRGTEQAKFIRMNWRSH